MAVEEIKQNEGPGTGDGEPEFMESKRARELRHLLAERFELDEESVRNVLRALVGSIHGRLGRGIKTCLISWIPETWPFLSSTPVPGVRSVAARGEARITEELVAAGLDPSQVPDFVATLMTFLESRCGRPLSEAVSRKVPELERMARM